MSELTTPFWLNNYIDPNGKTTTVCNPKFTRHESIDSSIPLHLWPMNCRLKVTRLSSQAIRQHSQKGKS